MCAQKWKEMSYHLTNRNCKERLRSEFLHEDDEEYEPEEKNWYDRVLYKSLEDNYDEESMA